MTKLYIPLINGQKGGDQRRLVLDLQTDGTWLILGVYDPANPGQDAMTLSGLALSTAGVSDSADKRFVTDAELGNLVILGPLALLEAQLAKVGARTGADSLLASVASVDMNTATPTPLYTVPAGKTCIVTKIFIRNCSGSLTTASISFGFTTPTFAETVAKFLLGPDRTVKPGGEGKPGLVDPTAAIFTEEEFRRLLFNCDPGFESHPRHLRNYFKGVRAAFPRRVR